METKQKSPGVWVVAHPASKTVINIIAAKLIDFIIDLLSIFCCFEIATVGAGAFIAVGIVPALAVAQDGYETGERSQGALPTE